MSSMGKVCAICGVNDHTINPKTKKCYIVGENYVAKGSGVYTCEAHRQWFGRNAKLQTVCPQAENGAPFTAKCNTCLTPKLHQCFSIGMRLEYNTQDVPQNSAKCAKRSRSNTTQATGFVPNQGTNYNVVPGHNHPGPHSTNTVATQQTNQGYTYPAQTYTQQFNAYNQGINASAVHTSTSPQLSANTSTIIAANNGNQGLNGLQTNNTITTPTNSSLDNRIEDMIFTFVNKIDLGQMSTNGDPLLDEMKKIQQNEHENKCRIQHIRRVLNDPGRLKQFLDNTGSHELANELVEMFKMDYPWPYRPDLPELPVVRASELRSGNTRYFFMDSSPRGRAIVFICADGLDREADRWESILGQLGFEQDVYRKAKCSQIRDVLLGVSGQPFDADALFVMFIGGRYDEKIHGYGGNEMWITEIVDIFSDTNCVSLRNKPKIFVFNTFSIGKPQQIENMSLNCNNRTYLINAHSNCTETNMNSWFNPTESITLFGQAFSYTIAQYACNLHLANLVNTTRKRLTSEHGDNDQPKIVTISVDTSREIYFNPGLYKRLIKSI